MAELTVFDERVCQFGEGPLWHPEREELFWVDIAEQKVLSRGANGQNEHQFDEMVSALGWVDFDTLLLATESGLYKLSVADWSTELVVPLEQGVKEHRSNDGRADPWGGFWISTMHKEAVKGAGGIYRYYDGQLRLQISDITIPNSLCFDANRKVGFFTDSAIQKTWCMRLDEQGWLQGEPELFLDFSGDNLTVDGALIDRNGVMVAALYNDGAVILIAPDGNIIDWIDIGIPCSTCPAFGGRNFSDLIVTTGGIEQHQKQNGPIVHGKTVYIPDRVQGVPEPRIRI